MRESFQNWLGKKQANPESLILLISACFRKLKQREIPRGFWTRFPCVGLLRSECPSEAMVLCAWWQQGQAEQTPLKAQHHCWAAAGLAEMRINEERTPVYYGFGVCSSHAIGWQVVCDRSWWDGLRLYKQEQYDSNIHFKPEKNGIRVRRNRPAIWYVNTGNQFITT